MQAEELIKIAKQYKRVFDSDEGKFVLADLKKRCFADVSTFDENPRTHAHNEGARSVYLTIQHMLDLDIKGVTDASKEEG